MREGENPCPSCQKAISEFAIYCHWCDFLLINCDRLSHQDQKNLSPLQVEQFAEWRIRHPEKTGSVQDGEIPFLEFVDHFDTLRFLSGFFTIWWVPSPFFFSFFLVAPYTLFKIGPIFSDFKVPLEWLASPLKYLAGHFYLYSLPLLVLFLLTANFYNACGEKSYGEKIMTFFYGLGTLSSVFIFLF